MYQYAEVVHWMKQQNSVIIPASVDIDLTNHCNQDCYYCESAEFRENNLTAQPMQDYVDLLNKLADWRKHSPNSTGSLHTVTFSGSGEPTLFKGYEKLIEQSIKLGFRTSMITNGVNLDKILNIDYKDIAWIGVDLDAGNQATYEKIRQTKGRSIFKRVLKNIKSLTDVGIVVDIKILLNEHNCTEKELTDIFTVAANLGIRYLYFRPTVTNGVPYDFRPYIGFINHMATKHNIQLKMNLKKFEPRTYSRCHQMYQFLIFCPDGKMYTCCENKGVERFAIGPWNQDDFRDLWLGSNHHDIYNSINTKLCPPCRSHNHNLAIQQILDDPDLMDVLYY